MIQFFQYCLVFFKYNKAVDILSKVVLHHKKYSSDQQKDFNQMFIVFLIHFQLVNVLIYLR